MHGTAANPDMCGGERKVLAIAITFAEINDVQLILSTANQETLMDTPILQHIASDKQAGWRTEEYHGRQMHVCAQPRAQESEALPGHGQQWDFTVKITASGTDPMAEASASAESDPELFYSTQAIAENMGFVRGRELIEAC